MSNRTVSRLRSLLCVALMASLIVQLVGGYDFRGLPFLYIGIAAALLAVVAILSSLQHETAPEKPA